MSSTFTEEQRKRMEENRQKALAKRAEAIARSQQSLSGGQRPNVNTAGNSGLLQQNAASVRNPSPILNSGNVNPTPFSAVTRTTLSAHPVMQAQNNFGQRTSTNVNFRPQAAVQNSGPGIIRPTGGAPLVPVVTGTLKLVSRGRFMADMGYHAQCIALFKQVPGAKYEPAVKRWTFPVSQHSKVVDAIDSLKPQVTAAPLPGFVLQVFRNVDENVERSIPDVDLSRIDPELMKTLLPFQKVGIQFGVHREGRLLNADDMGLGKTLQALGIAHYYYSEWPLLIVTPSSMRFTWRDSIWDWLPSVPGGAVSVVECKQDVIINAKVIIISYDLLCKRATETPIRNCKVVIMDESHHLKNHKTARAQACITLIKSARRAILLSGTPALSRPIELYTQVSALNPKVFPNVHDFGLRYCAGKKTNYGYDYLGSSNMEELQLLLEETVMIRRMKQAVLQELPTKRRKMVVLDPKLVEVKSKELQLKANAYMSVKSTQTKHGRLLEYYNETAKAKIPAVLNYLCDLIESGKKFICFAHHRCMMDAICDTLEGLSTKYIRIDGETPSEQRKHFCDVFQENPTVKVAVLSITSANAGITLTSASLVVFAELYWNPGILTQAEDRAHRIGQQDSVIVQYLVAKSTADDDLWTLVVEKLEVLNKAGLSKDNFRHADCEFIAPKRAKNQPLSQHGSSQGQKPISEFFQAVSSQPSSAQKPDGKLSPDPFAESFVVPEYENIECEGLLVNEINQMAEGDGDFIDDDNVFDMSTQFETSVTDSMDPWLAEEFESEM